MLKVKLFEQYIQEAKKPDLETLLNNKVEIEAGNSDYTFTGNDKAELKKIIIDRILSSYLFDEEFYNNYTEHKKEYLTTFKKETLNLLAKKLEQTIIEYFNITQKNNGYKLKFKLDRKTSKKFIDNWFQTIKISKALKQDYYNYRAEYAGVKLK